MTLRSTDEPNPHGATVGVNKRALRRARVTALAEAVLESKAAARGWLGQPQSGLGGRVPRALLSSESGAREVETLLHQIDWGIYV